MSRFFLRAGFVRFVVGFALLVGGARVARADEGAVGSATTAASRVFLVTVGPASDLFSLWGHAALCVSAGELVLGRCLDFGVATTADPVALALGTLRGEALFRAVEGPAERFLAGNQWRDVWVQELPLDEARRERVTAAYHEALTPPVVYAYEPVLDNCSTRLRDLLDRAMDGALGKDFRKVDGPARRVFAENALAGRVLPLTLFALSGNDFLDAATSDYERMAFPDELRLGVARHLGVAPVRLHTRFDAPPAGSPHVGKVVLVLLGLLWSGVLYASRKKRPFVRRLLVTQLGLVLGLFAAVPLFGATMALRSLAASPLLWVLWPTDVALGAFSDTGRARYVRLRLGVLAVGAPGFVIFGSAALLPAVVAVALPLGTLAIVAEREAS